MTKKVYYCAGHGKYTAGKRSPSGKFEEREWFFNNEVVLGFEEQLKKYNGVSLHRTDDKTGERDVPLSERTGKANSGKADIYISFHHNAFQSKWGTHTGVETFYYAGSKQGKALAQAVHPAVVKSYGLKDRGLKTNSLHITRETNMPAILIEGGFMDSTIDIVKLRDKKALRDAGRNIADAVAKYLKLSLKKSSSSNTAGTTKNTTKNTSKKDDGQIYRVRKNWNQPNTQIGAFKVLDNAKDLVNKNKDYKVFDEKGNTVYSVGKPSTSAKSSTTKTTAKSNDFKVGQIVTVKKSATKFATGQNIASFVKGSSYKVIQVKSDRVLLDKILSWVYKKDIEGYVANSSSSSSSTSKKSTQKAVNFKVGSSVKIKKSAKKFATGQNIAEFAKGKSYKIIQVKSDRVLLDVIMSWVYKKDVE